MFFMKGMFFENLKFVFLSNMIWATPKIVKIGAKTIENSFSSISDGLVRKVVTGEL